MSIAPLTQLSAANVASLRFILTDIDDTLTWQSQLPTSTYVALNALACSGLKVIPVTGGCAGWSDLIARLWPVAGVITEGGACFIHKTDTGVVDYQFWQERSFMQAQQRHLRQQVQTLLAEFPTLRLAQDQEYRLTDVAVDYAQDVIPAQPQSRDSMLARLHALGLQAKASSIHINIWQGQYDKAAMAQRVLSQHYGLNAHAMQQQVLYVGDAPNDESMFKLFPLSVGVANIQPHLDKLTHKPAYLTQAMGGLGFAELADYVLQQRTRTD